MSGARGRIIEKDRKRYATTDCYAVLFDYDSIEKFSNVIKKKTSIKHVFVVTDDEQRYLRILEKIPMIDKQNVHRLYTSYLCNFEIKSEGRLE